MALLNVGVRADARTITGCERQPGDAVTAD
jgi:hypothetical protein